MNSKNNHGSHKNKNRAAMNEIIGSSTGEDALGEKLPNASIKIYCKFNGRIREVPEMERTRRR